jgi:hypothetical protein
MKKTKTKIKTAALPVGLPVRFYLAVAAVALALLAIPHIGHAQGGKFYSVSSSADNPF